MIMAAGRTVAKREVKGQRGQVTMKQTITL